MCKVTLALVLAAEMLASLLAPAVAGAKVVVGAKGASATAPAPGSPEASPVSATQGAAAPGSPEASPVLATQGAAAPGSPEAAPVPATQGAPPESIMPELPPAPLPPPPPPLPPPRYGDAGTSYGSLILGLGSSGGGTRYAAGIDYGFFVLPGVAPGVELYAAGGSGAHTTGLTLATLQLVPLRTRSLALFVTGRAGRVFVADHADGWGAGGGGGLILFSGSRVGLQIAYEALHLFPSTFCSDFASGCLNQGFSVGLVAGF